MAVLIVGGLLVAALVVWALTRTVEPDTTATATFAPVATTADATMPPPPGTFAMSDTSSITMPTTLPTATAAPAPVPHPEGDKGEVKRIAAEDLRAQVSRNAVTVIDVRQPTDYQRGHIAGAINIPFASVETQFDTIPKDKPIVTYCT
jgi:hypothetical protein